MARVIQDSDDELDDDLEVDVHQPEKKDASPKQSNSDASSTEALQRQIEAAHRAHLQSLFSMNDDQTPDTLEVNHQKRGSNGIFNENFAPKKTPVTYGRNSNGIFCSSPADQQHNQSLLGQVNSVAGATNGTDWMLEGTMRGAYAQHNPNAMFPEPSSTVPNATLTQQRVMEGVLAPALLGSDVDNDRTPIQPDASIPWSEYLKSPTNSGEQPRSSAQEPHALQNVSAAISDPSPNEYPAPSGSQRSQQESLMLVGSPSTQNMSLDMLDAQDIIVFLSDEAQSEARQPHATSSSTVNGSAPGKAPSSSRQSHKKRPSPSPGPTSDDDLADLGLPKEQYKPRPGRSRSLKAGRQESIDYSVKHEKATKASRRRKSTPATTSLAKPLSTPDRIQQICEMGFTPSTSARALKQNNGDVTQTVDWLITNRVADDELSHASQMSKTGNDQLTANIDIHEHNGELQGHHIGARQTVATNIGGTSDAMNHNTASAETDIVALMVELRSPAKVQVLIPAKSPMNTVKTSIAPATSHKKAKRRKTTLDQPEPTAADTTVKGAKVEKKRGRGRPKKAAKASASMEILQDDEDEGSKEQARGSPLLSIDGNAQPPSVQQQVVEDTATSISTKSGQSSKSPQPGGATTVATTRSMSEPPELPDRPEIEPITPERVKKPAPPEQPPNNKGKVPYRVGLSKRARIAPLLRTMKK
ncbi:hypothetical protein BU25DRAFT_487485 [Macroventuria anomochaeta]|uniref:Uncharacterized protein n=1 Tax=Macroventuria anomochaeta TaxID=301207 RepID=A0ACB6SCX4_9PLEO|nr:uncharacterized protein BU25DRAFT_487485 [Macroventuria anomochaeta]KAF2631894.1 hypothetical protein BU25DRAFT_487485 [Macroventuria anomochaeta]